MGGYHNAKYPELQHGSLSEEYENTDHSGIISAQSNCINPLLVGEGGARYQMGKYGMLHILFFLLSKGEIYPCADSQSKLLMLVLFCG